MRYLIFVIFLACQKNTSDVFKESKVVRIRYPDNHLNFQENVLGVDSTILKSEIILLSNQQMKEILTLLESHGFYELEDTDNSWQNRLRFIQIELFNNKSSLSKLMNDSDSVKFSRWLGIINEITEIAQDEK